MTTRHTSGTSKPALLVFDVDGDLRLEVGKNKVPCLVCSKALARASPFFKRLLYGGFAESRENTMSDTGEWSLPLPEDDVNAMKILFDIIHGRPQEVPKILPMDREALVDPATIRVSATFSNSVEAQLLYLVALAADKYCITHIIKPWVQIWLDDIHDEWFDNWCGEVLWAAWLLGDEELLSQQLDRAVLSAMPKLENAQDGPNDVLVHDVFDVEDEIAGSDPQSPAYQMLDILNVWHEIPQIRLRLLKRIFDPLKSFLADPLTYMDPGCFWHMHEAGFGSDRTLVLETLQQCLGPELFPVPEVRDWIYDVNTLQVRLAQVKSQPQLKQVTEQVKQKCSCNPYQKLFSTISNVEGTRFLIRVGEEQRTHLKLKREESGAHYPYPP